VPPSKALPLNAPQGLIRTTTSDFESSIVKYHEFNERGSILTCLI
jgi:hypothetical protein